MNGFDIQLGKYFDDFFKVVSTAKGDWTVKGFIDIYKNIYTISVDTKVVSKIIELMIFPVIVKFSHENNYDMILSAHQNHYPDITFVSNDNNEKIALDLKSTYRLSDNKVNGMTLGAFTGYFRNRNSTKNITFSYNEYSKHYILGVIYSRQDMYLCITGLQRIGLNLNLTQRKELSKYISSPSDETMDNFLSTLKIESHDTKSKVVNIISSSLIDEKTIYHLDDLKSILSVVRDFDFFVQEKWKIAIDRPGSGNTKNIGSSQDINELKNGTSIFAKLPNGKEVFDDYWMYYLTNDMAKAVDLDKPPYSNIKGYFEYKSTGKNS